MTSLTPTAATTTTMEEWGGGSSSSSSRRREEERAGSVVPEGGAQTTNPPSGGDAGLPDQPAREALRPAKAVNQFYDNGCENCPFFDMVEDMPVVMECTSGFYGGIVSIIEPGRAGWPSFCSSRRPRRGATPCPSRDAPPSTWSWWKADWKPLRGARRMVCPHALVKVLGG